ncbi:hypothetical protein GWI33_017476 [Rhynchophorus ferrugineus]|nr:hypothetical protein GWI33_017476 [Rhynchophorus ferrugineus]
MLQVGPWNRLPLTIRWLNHEYTRDFPIKKIPPFHMPVCYGPVISKKLPKSIDFSDKFTLKETNLCYICFQEIAIGREVNCLNSICSIACHILCMSKLFLSNGEYVPIEGKCPKCHCELLWGDIVRKFKGCYRDKHMEIDIQTTNDIYCSDEDD